MFQEVPAGLYYVRVQHESFEDALQQVEVPSSVGMKETDRAKVEKFRARLSRHVT